MSDSTVSAGQPGSLSLYVFMVFLPLQSTNVATARLFPYLGPEGQTNAVATAPFPFTDYRIIPTLSRAAAEGRRRPAFSQAQ